MLRHHGKGLKLHEKVSKVLLREEGNLAKIKKLKNRRGNINFYIFEEVSILHSLLWLE
jgi:hypothetical protein